LDCDGLDAIGGRIKTGIARTAQELWMCCKSVEQEARARSDEARPEAKFSKIQSMAAIQQAAAVLDLMTEFN
jgi:hypothetical protein